MDKIQLKEHIDKIAPGFFKFVTSKLKNATYQSIVAFYDTEIVSTANNNYNNWGNIFYELKKYERCSLFDLGKLLTISKDGTVFWEDVTHTPESLKLQEERKKFNVTNGISLLFRNKELEKITIFINICSNIATHKDVFYKSIFKNKQIITDEFQRLLNTL